MYKITIDIWKSLAVLLLLSGVTGCGSNSALSGKVVFSDGSPVTQGVVNFVSAKALSRGNIQSDGTYKVGTLKTSDGLPKGTYKVYLSATDLPAPELDRKTPFKNEFGAITSDVQATKQPVAHKFLTEATTPLSCEIPAKDGRFDIVVEKSDQQ